MTRKMNIASVGAPKDLKVNATLTIDTAESSSNDRVAAYKYARSRSCYPAPTADDPNAHRFFTAARPAVTPSVGITPTKTIFTGDAAAEISALLWPPDRRGQDGEKVKLDSERSLEHPCWPLRQVTGRGAGRFQTRDLPASYLRYWRCHSWVDYGDVGFQHILGRKKALAPSTEPRSSAVRSSCHGRLPDREDPVES